MVATVFAPRGGDQQVALALATLATLSPEDRQTQARLDEVLRWTDEASLYGDRNALHRSSSAVDVLESALGDWPAPVVVRRLDTLYADRQRQFSSVLRRPVGGDAARRALGDLLIAHGEEMQRSVVSMAGAYLRAGLIGEAATRTARMAGNAGDDPELRALLNAAARPNASAADTLALARRFLPRVDVLGGTATDAPDPVVAYRVLEAGLVRHPDDPELLILSAHVARLLSSFFVAIRHLEEAEAVLEHTSGSKELQAKVSAELIELYFLRLRLRLDPERDAPAFAEADSLRQQFAATRQRFSGTELKVRDADIDFEVARSYVNTGQIDRAEPLFLRAREEGEPRAEVTVEIANLAAKRGDPRRAIQIIRDGLDAMRGESGAHDTIGSVEGRARLERLLGDSYDAVGERESAAAAWRGALIGWERLMVESLRRKSLTEAAEASVEVGRLLYVLGRHGEALQKFDEAIEADSDRDQSVHRRGGLPGPARRDRRRRQHLSPRPGPPDPRGLRVREGVHLAVDPRLTRRGNKVPDPNAEAYPRSLDAPRAATPPGPRRRLVPTLARYAVGQLPRAGPGAGGHRRQTRGDLLLRGMRRLADGAADDAHAAVEEGARHADVLVLRVRHGLPLPPRGRAHGARPASARRNDLPGPRTDDTGVLTDNRKSERVSRAVRATEAWFAANSRRPGTPQATTVTSPSSRL